MEGEIHIRQKKNRQRRHNLLWVVGSGFVVAIFGLTVAVAFLSQQNNELRTEQSAVPVKSDNHSASERRESLEKSSSKGSAKATERFEESRDVSAREDGSRILTTHDQWARFSYLDGIYKESGESIRTAGVRFIDGTFFVPTATGNEICQMTDIIVHPDGSIVVHGIGKLTDAENQQFDFYPVFLIVPAGAIVEKNWQTGVPIRDLTLPSARRLAFGTPSTDGGRNYDLTPAYDEFAKHEAAFNFTTLSDS
ncbi:hypothetical protein ACFQ3L_06955 [Lacticaseibacillus jixianensis]|uniref:Uncharacterized protein n=1 Tax=Lacticaseibacillus jixianensis TaxID=2486012 RepID=A0ABW4B925_9LACO|nr:hypothetical protein [Lacticaseibacillus jixianensis]